jgi:hypothetical protein
MMMTAIYAILAYLERFCTRRRLALEAVALRQRVGRPKVAEEVRDLIRRMKRENPTWGAPRIHGELLALGFEISEPIVSRYLRGLKSVPEESKASQWLAFLNNHREVIAAFDFFTVPTLWFRTLYRFFAIEHGRWRILHFNVTFHPTSDWIVQVVQRFTSTMSGHQKLIRAQSFTGQRFVRNGTKNAPMITRKLLWGDHVWLTAPQKISGLIALLDRRHGLG